MDRVKTSRQEALGIGLLLISAVLPCAAGPAPAQADAAKAERNAKTYLIAHCRQLFPQLQEGKGRELEQALALLRVPPVQRPQAVSVLRALREEYGDITGYAARASELFLREDDWAREVSVLAADQKNCRQASTQEQFSLLLGMEEEQAVECLSSLRPAQRQALTDYMIRNKVRASWMSWRVQFSPGLPADELRLVSWYLGRYTDYKPAPPPDAGVEQDHEGGGNS